MGEKDIRTQLQGAANSLLRAATRMDATERNRDSALTIVGVTDQILVLARQLYASPDPKAVK